MDGAPPHQVVVDYYTGAYREDLRFAPDEARPQGRLEWLRTREILAAVLPPPPARVLDVGGGPGAYARVLVGQGYGVRLLDLTPAHVEQARAGEPPVEAAVADARALPEPDGTYDAVLVMGPLYHLTERADRVEALREAVRVARPGAVVAVAAISRFAGPVDFASVGRLDDDWVDRARLLLGSGAHDVRVGFTVAYFHRVAELRDECAEAGLAGVVVHGVEGPAWPAAEAARHGPHAGEVLESALRLARVLGTEPEVLAASAHLLAVARTPA